jgi:uncharacterized repeat protein (TIGR01451 family)
VKRVPIAWLLAAVLAVLLFTALWGMAVPVSAGPNVQLTLTPRPKLTPVPGSSSVEPVSRPPRLLGSVLDWGQGNMPAGVQVTLRGDDWEIPVETNDSGEYLFQDVGNEVALLNAVVPDGRGDLVPLAVDLPVKVQVGKQLVVNMAFVPQGSIPSTLVGLSMVASPSTAEPNTNVSYSITVTNHWDNGINQVIVADKLPNGLGYVMASTSQGNVSSDRGLVWAELGPLAPGSSATVTIVAKLDPQALPETKIVNRVAAYHSENAAVQAETSITVTQEAQHFLPVTGNSYLIPVAGLLMAVVLLGARRMRRAQL